MEINDEKGPGVFWKKTKMYQNSLIKNQNDNSFHTFKLVFSLVF